MENLEEKRLKIRVKRWAMTAAIKQKLIGILKHKARLLCSEIEKLPASEQQTKISLLASDLYHTFSMTTEALRGEEEKDEEI